MYRLAIIGTRVFTDYELLETTLNEYKDQISLVVSGGAEGADTLGEYWANENNIKTKIFYPNWNKYGKRAGYLRNKEIVENSDAVIAFWDGKSRGTQHSFTLCEQLKKPLKIIRY